MTPWSIQLTTVVIPDHSSPADGLIPYSCKSEDMRKQKQNTDEGEAGSDKATFSQVGRYADDDLWFTFRNTHNQGN